MKDYTLYNKDNKVLSFSVNEITGDCFNEILINSSLKPFGFKDVGQFLASRKAPSNRSHIQDILRACQCDTLSGYLDVVHALSVNDSFWVQGAQQNLTWSQVNLYTNKFDETISRIAFSGGLFGEQLSSPSPEPTLGGSFAKCVTYRHGELGILKARQTNSLTNSWEPWSEVLSYQVAKALDLDCVPYELIFHRSSKTENIEPATFCPLFTNENIGFTPASAWLGKYTAGYSELLNAYSSIGSEDAFRWMVIFDALVLNTDRHMSNHGILFNNNTLEILSIAPIYDNNLAFCPSYSIFDKRSAFQRVREGLRPSIGDDFNKIASVAATPQIMKKVKELTDFEFDRSGLKGLPEERINILEYILHQQATSISSGNDEGFNIIPQRDIEFAWTLDGWPDDSLENRTDAAEDASKDSNDKLNTDANYLISSKDGVDIDDED